MYFHFDSTTFYFVTTFEHHLCQSCFLWRFLGGNSARSFRLTVILQITKFESKASFSKIRSYYMFMHELWSMLLSLAV